MCQESGINIHCPYENDLTSEYGKRPMCMVANPPSNLTHKYLRHRGVFLQIYSKCFKNMHRFWQVQQGAIPHKP